MLLVHTNVHDSNTSMGSYITIYNLSQDNQNMNASHLRGPVTVHTYLVTEAVYKITEHINRGM